MSDKVTGVLEVGLNDRDEIVINHPNLEPDENGVGHIVFSANQARNLAALLTKHADIAEHREIEKQMEARRKAAEAIPVDYDARELAGGKPITPDHREIDPATGQQKGYVVLSAAERAKRWVRPYRDKYLHIGKRIEGMDYRVITPEKLKKIVEVGGCATHTSMSRDIAETYSRAPSFYSKTFCCNCRDHFLLSEFVWLGTNEEVGS